MHIRDRFTYFEDQEEAKQCVKEWRQIMLESLPAHLHSGVRQMPHHLMQKVMDMMKSRIHFYSELANHTYFFEEPVYDHPRTKKFMKKLKKPPQVKIAILQDMVHLFKAIQREQEGVDFISREAISKTCSVYLFENKDQGLKNEDVFFLLRYALSGNPVGAPTGEIGEVLGLKEIIARCEATIEHI
mmetsp:Transcript_42020/g.64368  ORF Transcript_42020/g.64368 Transcript_42020/m.64368 type:complete len:186 (-) Transcript_42020:7-564(-)